MAKLRDIIMTAPILISLDLSGEGGEIILIVDASLEGWGAVLM